MKDYIKGRNPIIEALKSEREVKEIFFARGVKLSGIISEIQKLAGEKGIKYHFIDQERLNSMGGENNQGVLALVDSYNYLTLEEFLDIPADKRETILVLDSIQDPRNFGTILRTAECAGVGGVIIPERRSVQVTPVVEKSSAGALAYIPVARVVNLNTAIGKIKEHGYWVFGLSLECKSSYTDVDLTGPVCIVAGSEGEGLRPLVEKNCDFTIKLPVMGRINSLNVSVACGIVLYESLRQRKIKPDKKGKITLNS